MKKWILTLLAVLLIAGMSRRASALTLVYIVDAGGGFGAPSIPIVSGQSELLNLPAFGRLTLANEYVDFRVIAEIVLGTDRHISDPVMDTIIENFDYRIRIADASTGLTPASLALEPTANRGVRFVEFTQRGRYTLSLIRVGSVIGEFNIPLGGDIDNAANPIAGEQSQAIAALPGVGNILVAFQGMTLPAAPMSIPPTGGITGRSFESVGSVTNRLALVPESVSIGGKITLQATLNFVQPIEFRFKPLTGPAFNRMALLAADGAYSFNNLPPNLYTVSIKGRKWLRENIAVDAWTGNVSNADATLLAGDSNDDNFIDITDLLALMGAYNQAAPATGFLDAADFNSDGINDIADLLLLIGNYNKQGDTLP
jgi:hypothetical protein